MTEVTTTKPTRAPYWVLVKAVVAGVAAIGFFATVVIAPFGTTDALADQAFQARIHQEFVPELADDQSIELVSPTIEELPKPEPEPEPTPTAVTVDPGPRFYTGGGAPAEWMAAAGIPESDWWFVDQIVSRESGWNPNATNSSSGACGLVQAYPCSKVPGNGYDPVDNLRWAIGYANGRYGSWAGAHAFWQGNHWW